MTAEIIYGGTIRLPADFIRDKNTTSDDKTNVTCFVGKLRDNIPAIKPLASPHHDTQKTRPSCTGKLHSYFHTK